MTDIKYKCENCKLYRNKPNKEYYPIKNNKYPIIIPGSKICFGYPYGCNYYDPYYTDENHEKNMEENKNEG